MAEVKERIYIYGKHALAEALAEKPEVVQKVFAAGGALDADMLTQLSARGIGVSSLKEQKGVLADAVHQGVIAVINPNKLLLSFEQFMERFDISNQSALVLLDELQDPHNVGAIIRSATAFGAAGVLIPQHNQAQITGAVVKTSAGMTFRVPLISIGNVNQTLRQLKNKGFWAYGLDMEGNELAKETFDAPAVFVVGNEGEGIRAKTLELCDVKLSIPMHPRTESLNAAVSAGITLYQWSTQHKGALR
jgi:23S rRNA (guanosine2251-2'-O)-methyltransferase